MKLNQYFTFLLIIAIFVTFGCKNAETETKQTKNIVKKPPVTNVKTKNNTVNKKVVKPETKWTNTSNAKTQNRNTTAKANTKKSAIKKPTGKKTAKRPTAKISGKELTKYHLDQIKIINRNFGKKIKEAKQANSKKALRNEKELALKRFLGKDLYQRYKAKIRK